VLDPACGSGNFLYVTLEHLKRLEGEVIDVLDSLGDTQQTLAETGLTVDPHQLLGIELNPRAAVITDLVLWIGYLQWYFRTWGASAMPPEPVIKRFHNVECRDAILAWDAIEPVQGADGQPETQWDDRTMRAHPVTGEQVPDENARRQVVSYVKPRRAEWPEADFVVANPPFIGNWRMRGELGDGYVEALRGVYSEIPESIELVTYWWHRAAELAANGRIRRFGFITTNSIRQTQGRQVISQHLEAANPVSLIYAIPDHPWVDSTDGAAVRIAMTSVVAGKLEGLLCRVIEEITMGEDGALVTLTERTGVINSDLTIGPNVAQSSALKSNLGLSNTGVKLHGAGFIVTHEEAESLGLSRIQALIKHIRHYRNGRDITQRSRGVMVIDLEGLEIDHVRAHFPELYQHVLTRVKPERDQNRETSRRENWWLFGRRNTELRLALKGLPRYIATVETAKHRFFVFLDASILPDNMLVNIASADAYILGVLSSSIHVAWALAAGGTLEDRPRYNKSRCFEPFPFPSATESQQDRIRELGEVLDAHRKRQQELHPTLTMTQMYNVLEKLRSCETLNGEDRRIHEQGLISTLRTLHDDLDRAVSEAYGWPAAGQTEEILFRLVALNSERAAEERQGNIRYLRPEFQSSGPATQTGFLAGGTAAATGARRERRAWPVSVSERVRAIREVLAGQSAPVTPETLAKEFHRARAADLRDILETLVSLGQARQQDNAFPL
jgi:hypothetical protein